jgi:hypothetical protein
VKTSIATYRPEHVPAVRELNDRLTRGGSHWQFYDDPVPQWLPRDEPDCSVWREFAVVLDEEEQARGGLVVKPQRFRLGMADIDLLTWQGPVSEALVDRRFGKVGMQCLMYLRDRNPLLFGWGGSDQLNRLLEAFGWTRWETPLAMKIICPSRVARLAPFLRGSGLRARLATLAGVTGLAAMVFHTVQTAIAVRSDGLTAPSATTHRVDSFGDWADDIWQAVRDDYAFIALRDSKSLNRLMARTGWPDCQIHRIDEAGQTLGWVATRVSDLKGDKRFGDLRLGCIVDALALPGHEGRAVRCGEDLLRAQGVDLIAGHISHRTWIDAFGQSGFLRIARQRRLFIAPDLFERLTQLGVDAPDQVHLMPIDGDGPMGF